MPKGQLSGDEAWRQSSPFSGTNSVFFGSNGGGNGWAATPQSLYGESADGWSPKGHEAHGQDPKHIPSVPNLGGTNFAFQGADGYHFGWARKPHGAVKGQAKVAAHKEGVRATLEAAGGWSTRGHEAQPSKHVGSVPDLGGTNFAFQGADGYHYGFARKSHGAIKGQAKVAAHKEGVRATLEAAGGWSTRGHEAQPSKHVGSVPDLGGTNFAFQGADGYHYGFARKAPVNHPAGRVNKDKGVKQVHVAHPKLGWNF